MTGGGRGMVPRVPVSPAVLEWVVDQAGIEPEEVHRKFPKWEEWLTGERQPTLNQLKALAATAGVPFAEALACLKPERGYVKL
jgi:hypothetical protein